MPLSGEHGPLASMAEVLEHYMHHSEQLDTRMWLAANTDRAVGMLLQKLPGDGGIVPHPGEHDADTWQRVCHLGGTLSNEELLKEEPETVFRRLFWQENVQHFEPAATRFQCSCSREKVGGMLKMLGREEVDGVIDGTRRRRSALRVLQPALRVRSGRRCATFCRKRTLTRRERGVSNSGIEGCELVRGDCAARGRRSAARRVRRRRCEPRSRVLRHDMIRVLFSCPARWRSK